MILFLLSLCFSAHELAFLKIWWTDHRKDDDTNYATFHFLSSALGH